jgi:3,4-dihydroxy 2-butanone 4-phosphate synthase/GTP cyclohydrolase II
MKDDGTMARLADLEAFAGEHGLKIGTIAALIQHRSHTETLIEPLGTRDLKTLQGVFRCTAFRDRIAGGVHLGLAVGEWGENDEVPVRVHEPLSVMDLLDVQGSAHSWPLAAALAALQQQGRGVAVLLNAGTDVQALVGQVVPGAAATRAPERNMDLRTYGVGAQILRHLGVQRMKLLGHPRRMPSMTGYGLEVTGWVAPPSKG